MFFQKKPMLKGCIELSRIKCVEIVLSDAPIPCNYKYPFQVNAAISQINTACIICKNLKKEKNTLMSLQVFHDNYYLYIFAPDNDCRQRWVRALKEGKLFLH